MATKSKKSTKKNNKGLIAGICVAVAAVVAVVAIILAVVLNRGIDDSYFVSDDTKYVLTMEGDMLGTVDENSPTPVKTHFVYTYSGDEITGLKAYYEYEDKDTAKKAYDDFKKMAEESEDDEFADIALKGKYVVLTAGEDDYKDLKAADVKEQIEYMEMLKGMDLNSLDTEESTEAVEVEEVVEE